MVCIGWGRYYVVWDVLSGILRCGSMWIIEQSLLALRIGIWQSWQWAAYSQGMSGRGLLQRCERALVSLV